MIQYTKYATRLLSRALSSILSPLLLLVVLWFGFLFIVGKAFGKKAQAEMQKAGWIFLKGIFRLLNKGLRAFVRYLRT